MGYTLQPMETAKAFSSPGGCVKGYTFLLAGEKPSVNRKLIAASSLLQHPTTFRSQIISLAVILYFVGNKHKNCLTQHKPLPE